MTPILGIWASQNYSRTSFDSIATVTVGAGGTGSITFDNIPGTFAHLQIRGIARATATGWVTATFNDDVTASIYRDHYLYGNGTSAIAGTNGANNLMYFGPYLGATTSNVFGVNVTDILDYANTNKNKTVRTMWGYENNNVGGDQVWFQSQLWMKTNAITKITLSLSNFAQYSHFALYGIKAA
jgi:hypothetical protein